MNKLIALAFAVFSINAFAGDIKNDGYELLRDLKSCEPHASYSCGYSTGYISGIDSSIRDILFCPANTTRNGQIYDVVQKFLENNPQRQNEGSFSLVIEALQKAWPCPNPAPTNKK